MWGGIAAGAGILGGGILDMVGANQQNIASARQASAMMEFQREMSNTAHQREVEDLKKAGLNPILSANGGASTPSGAMASMVSPTSGMGDKMASAVGKGIEAIKSRAETDAVKKNAAKLASDTELNKKQLPIMDARLATEKANATAAGLDAASKAIDMELKLAHPEIFKYAPAVKEMMGVVKEAAMTGAAVRVAGSGIGGAAAAGADAVGTAAKVKSMPLGPKPLRLKW